MLHSAFPDPEALLSLEPEELAAYVLRTLASLRPGDSLLHSGNFTNPERLGHYSVAFREPVRAAILEAWNYLVSQGLLATLPGSPAGWVFVTRRGKSVADETSFAQFRQSALLPRALLHPSLRDKVWYLFIHREYDTAVFSAFKEVEVAVRSAARLADTDLGVNLVRKAFDPTSGSLATLTAPLAEREALAHLFAGAIGSYKNPASHRHVQIEAAEAVEMVLLASHLLRIVDARRRAA